jgi:hypothetical protein
MAHNRLFEPSEKESVVGGKADIPSGSHFDQMTSTRLLALPSDGSHIGPNSSIPLLLGHCGRLRGLD